MFNKNKMRKSLGIWGVILYAALSESSAGKIEALPESCQKKDAAFEDSMTCAKSTFTVNGDPVNPRIIQELMTGLSDTGDQIVSIDLLNSQNANRFFIPEGKMSVEQTGKFFKVTYTDPKCTPSCQFSYEVQGVTDGGVYVLVTASDGGGSGIFKSLVLVKIKKDTGNDVEKALQGATPEKNGAILPQKRLLIEKLGEAALGDRSSSNIQVTGNTIEVAKGSMQGQTKSNSTVTLEFPKS